MNARCLVPAVFAAMFISACTSPGKDPKPDNPPQAPKPRAKGEKTKADLLVGKWKLVKFTAPLNKDFKQTYEFTGDAKVTIWIDNPDAAPTDPEGNPYVQSGVYSVEGNKLTLYMTETKGTYQRNLTIDSITQDKLVIAYLSAGEPIDQTQYSHYERIRKK